MKDIVREYQEKFRRSHKQLRRYTALLLALALTTTLFVNWQLHSVGIAKTADYQCGLEEHEHTDACYTKVLVCGYEEGELEYDAAVPDTGFDSSFDSSFAVDADDSSISTYAAEQEPEFIFVPHEHTDDCWQEVRTLTCWEEEHTHTDDCFDPEDGSLICGLWEHTHDDSCYDIEYELVCGLDEGELVEEPNPDYVPADEDAFAVFDSGISVLPALDLQPVVVDDSSLDVPVHHHTDACYEEELTCGLEEHHHTVNCLADPLADTEDESAWLNQTGISLTGLWTDDLLTVAEGQLGYEQSEKNFELDADDGVTVRHYTRYGAWYGNAYGPWDVTFLSYCLNYAGIPQSVIPQAAGVQAFHGPLRGSEYMGDFSGDMPLEAAMPGDIVIYNGTVTKDVAVESEPLQVQDDSADADTALLAMDTAKTAPHIEEYTVDVSTVGIVRDVDEATGTLTVISGDVDGKVDTVSLSASQVTSLVSVATAQALAGGVHTMDINYVDHFKDADGSAVKDGGITSIGITKSDGTPITGSSVTLEDGETINLQYDFEFPENALVSLTKPVQLTYQLPAGIQLDHDSTFTLYQKNADGTSTEAGTFTVSKDGLVTIQFDNSFDATKPFAGTLQFQVTANVTGEDGKDESKVTFPTGTEITVKKPTDIGLKKSAGAPYTDENGDIYIDYTLTVSSEDGWNDEIILTDVLSNSTAKNGATGEYVKGSFALAKTTSSGTKKVDSFEQPTINGNTFTTDDLAANYGKLDPGESYVLTYKVKVTNIANADGSASFGNSANLKGKNDWEAKKTSTSLPGRVYKSGKYDPDTGKVNWTVTVKNPYGGDLSGVTVTDTVQTAGARIDGKITLTQTHNPDGSWCGTKLDSNIEPYGKDPDGFTYTFPAGSTGEEYQFTYTTTVPTDSKGDPASVQNDVSVKDGDDTYTDSDIAKPTDRKWSVSKSTAESSLHATDDANQYLAYWKLSSEVPNSWDSFQYLDRIRVPSNSKVSHYGIAAELDKAIRENLLFTCVDSTTHNAAEAGIDIDIKYYDMDFSDAKNPKGNEISLDSDTPVRAFVITLTNKGNNLTSPVKSMGMLNDGYYTHVDVTDAAVGDKIEIKNNDAKYTYEKQAPKKGLEKGVSTNDSGYQANVPDASYSADKTIYYQLKLDVSDWQTFPEDTITVTDVLPDGLVYKDSKGSTAATFYWYNSSGTSAGPYARLKYGSSYGTSYDLTKSDFFDVSVDGQTLTFRIKHLTEMEESEVPQIYTIGITYKATLQDSTWDRPQQTEKTYVNEASWGEKKAEASITLKRKTKPLAKSAEAEIVGNESRVHYTLNINPSYQDLLEGGDTLTLTDVLTVGNANVTAHLDMDSVKLYDYPYQEGISQALPTTSYQMSYKVDTDKKGQQIHTMTFKLDDAHGYVLQYDYVLDNVTVPTKLSNDAKLEGVANGSASSDATSQTISGIGSVSQSQISLYKVDSLNELTRLQGAEYKLSAYTNGGWVKSEQQFPKTDSDGRIVIHLGANDVNGNGQDRLQIETGKLYKMEEVTPPSGYAIRKGESAFYFAFGASNQAEEDIWNAVKADAEAAGLKKEQVLLCRNGQQMNYTMQNDRTWLTIQKFWQDEYGNTLTGSNVSKESIFVYLYRYPTGGDKATQSELVKKVELKKSEDWIYVYENVDSHYTYYIAEADPDNLHDVSYSPNNKDGVTGGGLLTLTNRLHKEYEKPGKLTINKLWLDSNGNSIADTSRLSAEFTLTKHTTHAGGYTVTIVPAANFSGADHGPELFAKKVPSGAYLYFISSHATSWDTVAKKYGLELTYDVHEDVLSGQSVYKLGPITSDLRIVDSSLYTADNELLEIEGGTPVNDTVDEVIGTVTLDASNGFSYTWTGLDTGDNITYTLTETTLDGYTTSYKFNGNELTAGRSFCLTPDGTDTMDVTNQAGGSYELPSTGGAGTKLYTAGGGALMLAALVCGFCTKRRRERRADR